MRRIVELLELMFRRVVVYPVLRLIFSNAPIHTPVDPSKISSILLLRYDKIGDMVVTIPIVRILKERMPRIRLGVLGSESNIGILEGERAVDDRFVLYRNPFRLLRELMRMRRIHYDVVLNFIFNRTTTGALIANFVASDGVKVGQGADRYRYFFNVLLELPRSSKHMLDVLIDYVESVFGLTVKDNERKLSFVPSQRAEQSVSQYLRDHALRRRSERVGVGSSYIVLNISAGEPNNQVTTDQAIAVATYLTGSRNMTVAVISAPDDTDRRSEVIRLVNVSKCISYPASGFATLQEVASLIEGAFCAITPDTSIVHFASAVGTPIVGLFSPLQLDAEWLPHKVDHTLIVARNGQPVSAIATEKLIEGIEAFLSAHRNEISMSRQTD
jgi:ADP-heptose:LPS heptosyltransferase